MQIAPSLCRWCPPPSPFPGTAAADHQHWGEHAWLQPTIHTRINNAQQLVLGHVNTGSPWYGWIHTGSTPMRQWAELTRQRGPLMLNIFVFSIDTVFQSVASSVRSSSEPALATLAELRVTSRDDTRFLMIKNTRLSPETKNFPLWSLSTAKTALPFLQTNQEVSFSHQEPPSSL